MAWINAGSASFDSKAAAVEIRGTAGVVGILDRVRRIMVPNCPKQATYFTAT